MACGIETYEYLCMFILFVSYALVLRFTKGIHLKISEMDFFAGNI